MLFTLTIGCADLSGGEAGVTLPDNPSKEIFDRPGNVPERAELMGIGGVVEEHPKAFKKVLYILDGGSLRVPLKQAEKELSGDFTLETWLRFEHDGNQVIMSATAFRMVLEGTRLFAELGDQRFSGPTIALHEWYHVALIVEGNQVRLHVNGAQQDRQFLPDGWARPSRVLVLGHREGNPRSFMGQAENLRMVGSAVYNEVNFNPSDSFIPVDWTVFRYDFDEELPGGIVVDVGGKGIDAELAGHAGLASLDL
jgi:hypothetical protein